MFHLTDAVNDMAESAPADAFVVVAAIDFGTTYSGYATWLRNDPTKIRINKGWIAGSEQLISFKTPTCILVNRRKKFHSFGYEAENKYADLLEDGNEQRWMFFRRFKMILHSREV